MPTGLDKSRNTCYNTHMRNEKARTKTVEVADLKCGDEVIAERDRKKFWATVHEIKRIGFRKIGCASMASEYKVSLMYGGDIHVFYWFGHYKKTAKNAE